MDNLQITMRDLLVSLCVLPAAITLLLLAPASVDAQACKVYGSANNKIKNGVAALCAEVKKGTWYKWGGGHGKIPGPTGGGFDCSGFSRYYYFKATGRDPFGGTTANGQFTSKSKDISSRIPASRGIGALIPGDIVYFGTQSNKSHVGVYIGGEYMVEAQKTGTQIKVSNLKGRKTYAGALRMRY